MNILKDLFCFGVLEDAAHCFGPVKWLMRANPWPNMEQTIHFIASKQKTRERRGPVPQHPAGATPTITGRPAGTHLPALTHSSSVELQCIPVASPSLQPNPPTPQDRGEGATERVCMFDMLLLLSTLLETRKHTDIHTYLTPSHELCSDPSVAGDKDWAELLPSAIESTVFSGLAKVQSRPVLVEWFHVSMDSHF